MLRSSLNSSSAQAGQPVADKGAILQRGGEHELIQISKYVRSGTFKTSTSKSITPGKGRRTGDHMKKGGVRRTRVAKGCHGPGAEHVAGGGDKTKIFVFEGKSRQETSNRCLTCHGEGKEQSHFAESAHASSDVGCLDCHSPHHAKEAQHLLVQSQPQSCYRMPHRGQSGFRQTVSPPRQRGSGAVQ